jgi:hypothetical protein
MNTGRFAGAGVAVFLVRFALNFLFYGVLIHPQYEAISNAHPGMFREVIFAYGVLDFVAAFLIVWFFVKCGGGYGGGVKAGVTLGILLGLFGPVLCAFYYFFSTTYYPTSLLGTEIVYVLVSHAIQGAVAALVYKTT